MSLLAKAKESPAGAAIRRIPGVMPTLQALRRRRFADSARFWEENYADGGDSGPGSYGKFAEFKAEVLNDLVAREQLIRVIEFGCGDGNQVSLADYPEYIGLDVSESALSLCKSRFCDDPSKSFFRYTPGSSLDNLGVFSCDLGLSLDVVYHLVEDAAFEAYMFDLFKCGSRYVVVYSSDSEHWNDGMRPGHVRHRNVSSWIEENVPEWRLVERIPNRYPFEGEIETGSFADFMIFQPVEFLTD